MEIQPAPISTHAGHTSHIDVFCAERHLILTIIDKLTQSAITKSITSCAIENITKPLQEISLYFGMAKVIINDNEMAFHSD